MDKIDNSDDFEERLTQAEIKELKRLAGASLFIRLTLVPGIIAMGAVFAVWDDIVLKIKGK